MRRNLSLALLASVVVAFSAGSARAATVYFDILLDGLQETPPIATPAFGDGTLTLDDATGDYTISGNFYDLLGVSNNAHIHGPAAIGAGPAGVVVGLTFDIGVSTGTYSGAGTFTALQMADLLDELYYVNIHSSVHGGGEIRGQILVSPIPEPSSALLVGLGLAAVAAAARRRGRA